MASQSGPVAGQTPHLARITRCSSNVGERRMLLWTKALRIINWIPLDHPKSKVIMERVYVSSSNIRSIGYDAESLTLEVEFNSGAMYQFQGVPLADYDALMNAGSKGTYFNANIKKQFPCVKL